MSLTNYVKGYEKAAADANNNKTDRELDSGKMTNRQRKGCVLIKEVLINNRKHL